MCLNRLLFEPEEVVREGEGLVVVRLDKEDARARHVREVRVGGWVGGWVGRRETHPYTHVHAQILKAQGGDTVRVGVLNGGW